MKSTSGSIDASPLFLQLRTILCRYASTITVDGILSSVCTRMRVPPSRVDRDHLDRIIQELHAGVRIFCEGERVPAVMQELNTLMRSPDGID